MVSNQHLVSIFINKQLVELKSQEDLNLRVNSVLFDPTKTQTTQAEYSYSFSIPSTPNNDKIFNFANNLSKLGKFHARYSCEVYADGHLIFNGSLTVQGYDSTDKMYSCNLVNIKINTLDEIFGESVMTDVKGWSIPFQGASTINLMNADNSTKCFFPLVSYGVFQKNYANMDEVAAEYTPKHDLDKYNKWWVESFYPSLNMLETMKKAFQWKGYNVGGSAFSDENINNIFCSTNLAQEQVPIYNLGNPRFGSCKLQITWNNYASMNSTPRYDRQTWRNLSGGFPQDLQFPYYRIAPASNAENFSSEKKYNFSTIDVWNICDSINNSAVTVNVLEPTYIYDPNEQVIVIPSDGWYKIRLTATATLSGAGSTFSANQWTNTFVDGDSFEEREVEIKRGLKELTPLEIQLIRNYDGNVELIKGKTNITYDTGDPSQETYIYRGRTIQNKKIWDTDFPHQDLYGALSPTETEGLLVTTSNRKNNGQARSQITNPIERTSGGQGQGRRNNPNKGTRYWGGSTYNTYGYAHRTGFPMVYDQAVSEAFICGFSTLGDGTAAVMRNGMSWSRLCGVNNRIFAEVKGMDLVNKTGGGGTETLATDYCSNTYGGGVAYISETDNAINGGEITCCVYLNRNDILEIVAIQRDYDGQKYACSINCQFEITAMSERSEDELRADSSFSFYSQSEFPTELNLFNFTNSETKVSDWITSVQKAFNLEINQDGNNIEINTNQGIKKTITNAIELDNRVSSDQANSEYISYPSEMSVQYKIDTEEWGFELTVPSEHINDEDWKEWGDSGYTIIHLDDDTYNTDTQNTTTNFSYTYYDNFNWKEVNALGEETGNEMGISIPVLSKSEYMVEGYNYEESMKHDGYSLAQRFWFRTPVSDEYVWLSDHQHQKVYLSYPINSYNRFNLSYKDTEKSIVTEYFNLAPMLASNYVEVEAYISPEEYLQLKGGALCHYDSDLYYCSQISGFDPSGSNPTTLKLIKKI